jgi:hypothetical protein
VIRLGLDHALAEVAGALARADVEPLLLKGPAFARWLYDDPRDRGYGDIDLLIAPAEHERAQATLVELGFTPYWDQVRPHLRGHHHDGWRRDGLVRISVELHRALFLLGAPPEQVWERFSADAIWIEVTGTRLRTTGPRVSTLIVALHAAQHGAEDSRHMEDLRRAIERVEFDTWRAAASLAQELGATQEFAAGVRLDPGGGERLADQLGLPVGQPRLLRLIFSPLPDSALGVERLLHTRGLRARFELIYRELVPTRVFMRKVYPWARRGRTALIAAYLARPFLVVAKFPRAIRAWSRATASLPDERRAP